MTVPERKVAGYGAILLFGVVGPFLFPNYTFQPCCGS